jgi:hypothetical protein
VLERPDQLRETDAARTCVPERAGARLSERRDAIRTEVLTCRWQGKKSTDLAITGRENLSIEYAAEILDTSPGPVNVR